MTPTVCFSAPWLVDCEAVRAAKLTILLSIASAAACGPGRTFSLEPGAYASAEADDDVTLELDLEANRAVLQSGEERVELRLERIEDPKEWPTDCGTMTGPAHVELARIVPPGFELDGRHHQHDGIRSSCGAGIELVRDGVYESWRFDRAH